MIIRNGTLFLNDTINLSQDDNNIIFTSYPNETAWISGGVPLYPRDLNWSYVSQSLLYPNASIYETSIDSRIASQLYESNIFSLFTLSPHTRVTRARYPNGDIETYYGGEDSSDWIPFSVTVEINKNVTESGYFVSKWHLPPLFELPQQIFKNLSCDISDNVPCKNSSHQTDFNIVTFGVGGACDLWFNNESYWCGKCFFFVLFCFFVVAIKHPKICESWYSNVNIK